MKFSCSVCDKVYDSSKVPIWLCDCGKPLVVHYNWENKVKSIDVIEEELSLWRYKSVLPDIETVISLGEGHTPLIPISNNVYVKDETVNPTGSFKDRGMALAVTMAKAQGVETICLPSAGNAGISAAAY